MKLLYSILICCILLCAHNSYASSPQLDNIVDLSNQLSEDQKDLLNYKLNNVKVLIVPSLNKETIEKLSQDTFDSWKLNDDNILITISIKDRISRIQTGKNIESKLLDQQANDILRYELNPYLRNNDLYGGLSLSSDAINLIIHPNKLIDNHVNDQYNTIYAISFFIMGVIFSTIIFAFITLMKTRKLIKKPFLKVKLSDRSELPTKRSRPIIPSSHRNVVKMVNL